jgi:hypothetical protein
MLSVSHWGIFPFDLVNTDAIWVCRYEKQYDEWFWSPL